MIPNPHPTHHQPAVAARLHWPTIVLLSALALLRPLVNALEAILGVDTGPVTPITLTLVISAIWILVVGLRKVPRPVLTLALVGVSYGVLAIVLSGILSPIIDGRLEGPLANPIAIAPMLTLNAGWGLLAGVVAMLVQRARGDERQGSAAAASRSVAGRAPGAPEHDAAMAGSANGFSRFKTAITEELSEAVAVMDPFHVVAESYTTAGDVTGALANNALGAPVIRQMQR